jgi:hypothetical protein
MKDHGYRNNRVKDNHKRNRTIRDDSTSVRDYGYNDPLLVKRPRMTPGRVFSIFLALLFIAGVWLALDFKLLFGHDWISATYDHVDWRTNEGNLPTYGAWDLEAHIWKTEFIMENFPNFHWNPYWYLGMPLLKYYQLGFYMVHAATILLTGLSAARASLLLIIFSHLFATILTFVLAYKVSGRIWISAFSATFLLSNTFISLRSYGWEPITVVFLFLYPLGLLLFLSKPLQPFRFWLILTLGIAFLTHPLLWFSLLMTMGIYLFSIAIRRHKNGTVTGSLPQYFATAIASVLVGAVQFIPQMSYHQVTSGAHMGVKYLPYYQVPFNIISLKDFFFDAGNLKGPGPIVMIAFLLIIVFGFIRIRQNGFFRHELVSGFSLVLFMMVLFYYLELLNMFPMNLLRQIQYHRIIPEFIITAVVVVAAMSNIAVENRKRIFYYAMVVSFTFASFIVIYFVQTHWMTTRDISTRPEFIHEPVVGRISFPYTDQSLSVRNSFTHIPQVYGYYEQGITNAYNDEIFSVSSGFHNANITLIYLKAANVGRVYINVEEGRRDLVMRHRMNDSLEFFHIPGQRYGYFIVPLANPSFSQAISRARADWVQEAEIGCRELFTDIYCESDREEFVTTDPREIEYLSRYVKVLEEPYSSVAEMTMVTPQHYRIDVRNAEPDTAVVVKMTYDKDFRATVDGREIEIMDFGPQFMLLSPQQQGDYTIYLEYRISRYVIVGAIISLVSIIMLALYSLLGRRINFSRLFMFKKGDM